MVPEFGVRNSYDGCGVVSEPHPQLGIGKIKVANDTYVLGLLGY